MFDSFNTMDSKTNLLQKPKFVDERCSELNLRLGFLSGTHFEDLKSRTELLFQYAIAKRRFGEKRNLQLCLDRIFYDQWDVIWETMVTFFDQLPMINGFDFQGSDLELDGLLRLYQVYLKSENMENLPIIGIYDTFAHDEYKELFKKIENEERGPEFLKRILFPENKYLAEPWIP